MPLRSLYEITAEGLELSDLLIESMGEITEEVQAKMDDILASGADRIEAAAMVVKDFEASAEACKAESKRLQERSKQFEATADRLKGRMCVALDAAFGGKIKTPIFTVYTQANPQTTTADLAPGFTPEMLLEECPSLVRIKYEFDRSKAVALFKSGETAGIPDSVFFQVNPPSRSVRIR